MAFGEASEGDEASVVMEHDTTEEDTGEIEDVTPPELVLAARIRLVWIFDMFNLQEAASIKLLISQTGRGYEEIRERLLCSSGIPQGAGYVHKGYW